MIEPDMQIVRSSLSLLMIDITTLTIETWRLDVSLVWSCFQFVAWPNWYAANVFVMVDNTVLRLLMCLTLGSSLTMSSSEWRTLDIAKIFACIHVGGVRFASISTISLSTCGSHTQVPPEIVCTRLVRLKYVHWENKKNQRHNVITMQLLVLHPMLHYVAWTLFSNYFIVVRFHRCNLCLVLITLGLVLLFHAIYDVLIFLHFTAQIQNDFIFIVDLIFQFID